MSTARAGGGGGAVPGRVLFGRWTAGLLRRGGLDLAVGRSGRAADIDLLRGRLGDLGQAEGQDAVLEFGLSLVLADGDGDIDAALDRAEAALAPVEALVLAAFGLFFVVLG